MKKYIDVNTLFQSRESEFDMSEQSSRATQIYCCNEELVTNGRKTDDDIVSEVLQ